jgi:hypothetical protein
MKIQAPDDQKILETLEGPLIYLAGPIQGAVDWQKTAIDLLGELAPDVHIASPRASRFTGTFEAQLKWETAFINHAARTGVIVFFLSKEISHRCNRAYAQQARFELGEWAALSRAGLARVIVGIEYGFTGGPYLRRRLTLAYPNIPICTTLRQTCAGAAELAHSTPTTLAYSFLAQASRVPPLEALLPRPASLVDDDR